MSRIKQLEEETAIITVLNHLVQAYESMFVVRMAQTRDEIIGMREYIYGLQQTYNNVRLDQTRLQQSQLTMPRTGNVAILLSPEHSMSGQINQDVFRKFLEYRNNAECDVIIVGEWGRDMYTQLRDGPQDFTYIEVRDGKIQPEELDKLVSAVRQYKTSKVFYGKYENLVHQSVAASDIGDQSESSLPDKVAADGDTGFLYEPNVDQIAKYFEDQIFTTVLNQTSKEGHLAQLGSRILTLEQALVKIDERLRKLKIQHRKQVRRAKHKKQLQAMTGLFYVRSLLQTR